MSWRLYSELAGWWSLMAPPERYASEAELYYALLRQAAGRTPERILELGSGAGYLAHHLPADLTLVDLSAEMLAVSREINPGHRHLQADIRSLDLGGEQFDAVLLHDAVMYLTGEDDLRATFARMFQHCRPGGAVLVVPDVVAETFEPLTTAGGEDGEDGRALRMLEWHWDPDPGDQSYQVEFSVLLREADGRVRSLHEAHTLALFARKTYWRLLREAGFVPVAAEVLMEEGAGEIFLARRPALPAEAG